jgi:Flp pilus assembly protein TadG
MTGVEALFRLSRFSEILKNRLLLFKVAQGGVAAVEFALVLPVMLTMYLGMVEVTQGVNINRKVTLLSRTLADLTAQNSTVNNNKSTQIFAASTQVMSPYNTTGIKMLIVSAYIRSDSTVQVCWGDQTGGMTVPSTVTLPAGLIIPSTSIIIATAELPYTPAAKLISASYTLNEVTYMRPRYSTQVTRDRNGTLSSCPTT